MSSRAYLAVLGLALAFGTLYAATLDARGMFVWDEAEYASLARSVLRGEGFAIGGVPNALRPPVVPLAAAASMALTRSSRDLVLKLPNVLFSLGALLIVYWCVTTEYGSSVTGVVAAALLGLFPAFWQSTPLLLAELPYTAFFTGAVVFFYRGLYRAPRFFYGSWLCWGLAASTRYTAVLFGPLVLVFLAVAYLSRSPEAARHVRSRHFVLSPLAGAALVVPWLIRQHVTFGDALVGFKQASTQLPAFLPGVSMPWYFYGREIPAMLSPIPAVLLALGLWWAVRARDRFGLHCLLVAASVLVWFSAYRFKEVRQVTSVLPFLAVLAALGATKFWAPGLLTRRRVALVVGLLAAVLVTSAAQVWRPLTRAVPLGYPSFLHAMRFLHAQAPAQAVLVGASHPQIHWYTERRVVDFPDERELPAVLARSEWVIVTSFERGQRAYAVRLLETITSADVQAGDAAIFRDPRFVTALIRARLLRERL